MVVIRITSTRRLTLVIVTAALIVYSTGLVLNTSSTTQTSASLYSDDFSSDNHIDSNLIKDETVEEKIVYNIEPAHGQEDGVLRPPTDDNEKSNYTLRIVYNKTPQRIVNDSESFQWEDYLCRWTKPRFLSRAIHMDIFMRDVVPPADRHNIFLLETGCKSVTTARTLCALESFLENNPESLVWYIVTSDVLADSDWLLTRLHRRYSHLRLAAMDLNLVFEGAPSKSFFHSKQLLYSNIVNLLMSDMTRQAIIWKFGGLYSDSDVVCLRDVSSLRNIVAFENQQLIGSSVFHFEKGHQYLYQLMQHVATLNETGWTSAGPEAMTATMKKHCGPTVMELFGGQESRTCKDLNIMPHETFFPLRWTYFEKLFHGELGTQIRKAFPLTYVMHLTGSSSDVVPADVVAESSFFKTAAEENCPLIYSFITYRNRFI